MRSRLAGAVDLSCADDEGDRLRDPRRDSLRVRQQTFPGRVTLKAEKATPAVGVAHIVDVARAAGYPNAALATP